MELVALIIFLGVCIFLGLFLVALSNLLGKKPSHQRQNDIYESGVNAVGSAISRYDIKFYLTAILFLLFDVEIVLLFPWALSFKKAPDKFLLISEFVIFMVILLVGYLFIMFSKSLDWED